MSPISGFEQAVAREVVLSAEEVRDLAWKPMTAQPGVKLKVLWSDPRDLSYAGVMRLDPSAKLTEHAHRFAIHHVWVTEGRCSVGGRPLGPGAYCFVSAGASHGIDATGLDGCTLFYLYLRAELD